ncbi:MAG: calcium-binding protein [Candidatus Paceibacterota bacterium]|jgi:hypothetical protein
MKLGDSVIVKQGVKEPDLEEFEIGGWQGRVVDIDTKSDIDNILITIEWDSLTLKQIPSNYIEQSEREGLDWENMTLHESELEKTKPRDKKENVKQTQEKLSDKHYWDSLGDEGIRISKVLDKVNPHDEMKCLQKWVEYLDNELTFPIHAIVSDSEDNWLIKSGDKVIIKSLPHIVDMYGIIASIRLNGEKYEFPLCDLEAIDKTKVDFQLIDDYRTWFANR